MNFLQFLINLRKLWLNYLVAKNMNHFEDVDNLKEEFKMFRQLMKEKPLILIYYQ